MSDQKNLSNFKYDAFDVEKLASAVENSGYPLQAAVVDKISEVIPEEFESFFLQEEWSYVDKETGQPRAIDALLEFNLTPGEEDSPLRQRLNIVIECKQSASPYVVFLRDRAISPVHRFPLVCGLKDDPVPLMMHGNEKDKFQFGMPFHDLLELHNIPFLGSAPPAISISKAVWKPGKKMELTGTQAYDSLVYPLTKAAQYLKGLSGSSEGRKFVNLKYVIPVAVLRSPIAGVVRENGKDKIIPMGWARVHHFEPSDKTFGLEANVNYFDVVHEDFLESYLERLFSGMKIVAERADSLSRVLIDNCGCMYSTEEGASEQDSWKVTHEIHEYQKKIREENPDRPMFTIGRRFR